MIFEKTFERCLDIAKKFNKEKEFLEMFQHSYWNMMRYEICYSALDTFDRQDKNWDNFRYSLVLSAIEWDVV